MCPARRLCGESILRGGRSPASSLSMQVGSKAGWPAESLVEVANVLFVAH